MEDANRSGVILEERVQAPKPFSTGSQVNVSVRKPGEIKNAFVVLAAQRLGTEGLLPLSAAVIRQRL